MEPLVKVSGSVQLLVTVSEQEGVFTARFPFLNIVTQGASRSQAIERGCEEMQVLFAACEQKGVLEALLAKRMSLAAPLAATESSEAGKRDYVEVPVPEAIRHKLADAAGTGA